MVARRNNIKATIVALSEQLVGRGFEGEYNSGNAIPTAFASMPLAICMDGGST